MKRHLSLLLLVAVVGCSAANGGPLFITSSPGKGPTKDVATTTTTTKPAVKESQTTAPSHRAAADVVPTFTPSLTLPAALNVKAGKWLFVTATTNCAHVIWEVYDPTDDLSIFPEEMLTNPFMTVISSNVPGQYRIKAIAAVADQPVESDWCVITVLGAQPPPNPPDPPKPQPPAPPVPVVTGPLQIVVIENYAGRTQAGASLDIAYWQKIRGAGNTVYLMDSNNQAQAGPFLAKAGNPKVPMVIFGTLNANKEIQVIGVEPLPDVPLGTPAGTIAQTVQPLMSTLITKYGGKVAAKR